jgi:uncharacterized protein YecE (DUF72 family)
MGERILVGTSGWHYAHWKGPFYPEKMRTDGMFAFYCERFRTVEINNSFYRLPSKETLQSWRTQAPTEFTFSVKASRFITHMRKPKDPEESLERLLSAAAGLGTKLGVVLFQLPPYWAKDFRVWRHSYWLCPKD